MSRGLEAAKRRHKANSERHDAFVEYFETECFIRTPLPLRVTSAARVYANNTSGGDLTDYLFSIIQQCMRFSDDGSFVIAQNEIKDIRARMTESDIIEIFNSFPNLRGEDIDVDTDKEIDEAKKPSAKTVSSI